MQGEMPQAEAQAPQEGGGDTTKLAQMVGSGLAQLSEKLNAAPGATDADKQKMAMVLNGFIELVESNLSQAPGQDMPPEEGPMPSQVPAEGGVSGVPMGPQGIARK